MDLKKVDKLTRLIELTLIYLLNLLNWSSVVFKMIFFETVPKV